MCSYEYIQTIVKVRIKHNKIQDVDKLNRRYYHLQKIYHVQKINIKKKYVGFKNNVKKHG